MLVKSPLKKEKVKKNKRSKKKSRTNDRYHKNGDYGKRINSGDEKKGFSLPTLKPWKVILGAIVLGVLGILYLSHVFATQELLREVNRLEQEYNQVKRVHSDYQLMYDRMTGPAEIYDKAQNIGLINGGPAEKVIEVEK